MKSNPSQSQPHAGSSPRLNRGELELSAVPPSPEPGYWDSSRAESSSERLLASLPHAMECQVQRLLLAQPDLHFRQLAVHRIDGGVCLEGVLDSQSSMKIPSLALQVQGVTRVIDRLLYCVPETESPRREMGHRTARLEERMMEDFL